MGLLDGWQIPTGSLDFFIRSVEIASYLPGRIRLYSSKLVGDERAAQNLKSKLKSYAGIESAEINTVTGSILIAYDPQKLALNPELKKVEEYIKTHAKKRGSAKK